MVDIQILWEETGEKSEANDEVPKICFNDCSPSCHLIYTPTLINFKVHNLYQGGCSDDNSTEYLEELVSSNNFSCMHLSFFTKTLGYSNDKNTL